MVKQHRKFAGDGTTARFRAFLAAVLPAIFSPWRPEVTVLSEGAKDVVGAAYQKTSEHLVALPRDALLWITLPRVVFASNQTQVSPTC